MEGEKGRVCVTGATGYVASWLIKRLLHHRYYVHATVRSHPGNKKDVSFLTTLPKASTMLKIFTADLNDPNSFKPAMEGCIGVFHLAHPMEYRGEEAEEAVTNRAIQGVIGILRACMEIESIKRVVLMGSISSVISTKWNISSEFLDEHSWTDLEVVRAKTSGAKGLATYPISKTLTEKAAMEFANANGLNLVVLIPPLISGPFLLHYIPNSVSISFIPLLGNPFGYPMPRNMGLVHVDDVARAQIFLFEKPDASGRYICSAAQVSGHEISQFLAPKYSHLYQQNDSSSSFGSGGEIKTPKISSKKLLEAGFVFKYGVPEIYDDAIKCCKEKGLLNL